MKQRTKNISWALAASGVLLASCQTQKRSFTLPENNTALAIETASRDTLSLASFDSIFQDEHLKHLIDTALQNNFDLIAATQRLQAASANMMIAKNAWLPTVNAVASAGVDRYGDYTLNGVGNYDTNLSPNINEKQRIPTPHTPDYFLGIRSSWEVDIWGKIKQKKQSAIAQFFATQEGRRLLQTQVVAGIMNIYYELQALDNELEIIRSNVKLQDAALATVHIQKAGGRATELAVQQFQAQLLSTKALEYNVLQEITALENQLNALLGRLPRTITRSKLSVQQSTLPTLQQGIPASLLLNRPDIQQAEWQLKAAKADVNAARLAFLPSLSITPYVGFNAFRPEVLFQTPASLAWGVLGGLTAPIFNQKQLKGNFNQQKANAFAMYYGYQQTIVNSYQEVATQLNKVSNQQEAFKLKQQEVMVLQNAVSTANTLYSTGYASYLEVITAQKSVLEAELTMINTRRQVFQGLVQLYRALGGG
ncbi:NodT family efflux transporter outer membrane factor (OMF) lipoprotein [Chitinophaga skermanii]|uniref:NodT family efflux transporter outer membrane factor (OMF) lipoprotein n=1 Tax=Chitinophaga skermanii TaxID=331697 RepID=A0A327Q0M0_9BACT|nr:efflux transporter outer membrane subunit [Chitinophaga skermanii]RAI97859.1 NodT family efflux transporter outer membrane factor (OMF) lipoprotein [Chitinophaga skermanii]